MQLMAQYYVHSCSTAKDFPHCISISLQISPGFFQALLLKTMLRLGKTDSKHNICYLFKQGSIWNDDFLLSIIGNMIALNPKPYVAPMFAANALGKSLSRIRL